MNHSLRALLVALAAALVLTVPACGDDDSAGRGDVGGQADATGGSTLSDCDVLSQLFLLPVDATFDEADDPRSMADRVDQIADERDDDHSAFLHGVAKLLRMDESSDSEPGAEEMEVIEEVTPQIDDAIAWVHDECPTDDVIWGCSARSSFEAVGPSIGGSDDAPDPDAVGGGLEPAGADETTTTADPTSTPESVVGGGPDGTERIEVAVEPERVVYAWVDDSGLARQGAAVVLDDGAWKSEWSSSCN